MWRNYFTTAIRALLKYRGQSIIHIGGLTIGVTAFLLIGTFCLHEMNYDKFQKNSERTYRVWREFVNQDGSANLKLGSIAYPFAPLLKQDFPQFEEVVQLIPEYEPLISVGDKNFIEQNFWWTDVGFFKTFDVVWIQGDPTSALTEPNSIVIIRDIAEKYFGGVNALGHTITIDNRTALKITGVIENFPSNSSLQVNFIGSAESSEERKDPQMMQNYGGNNYPTFVLLKSGEDIASVESVMQKFLDRHVAPSKEGLPLNKMTRLHFQPISDIHLYSGELNSDAWNNGDIQTIYILGAVAVFVLLIACFNYMNLATARSSRRGREIGMRKTLGAGVGDLRLQFLVEAFLLALFSVILGAGLVELFLPHFNSFVGGKVDFHFFDIRTLSVILVLTIGLTFFAGWYPAMLLARMSPITALKSQSNPHTKSRLRSGLVVVQFAISITLLIAMGVVYRQLQFIKSNDLGITKDPVVVLTASESMTTSLETFKHKLMENPSITHVSAAKRFPSGRLLDAGTARMKQGDEMVSVPFRISSLNVDHDYVTTFGFQLVAGRNFDKSLASDSTKSFILNESAIKKMGYVSAEEAIGQPFYYSGRDGFIIGIVKDFNFESMHREVSPICMRIWPTLPRMAVRIKSAQISQTIDYLKKVWSEWRPGYPFEFYFIDQQFAKSYEEEEKMGRIFGIFASLAIVIACLGLVGLIAFMAEQRTKEIGVRKVLGATVRQIMILLAREFALYVLTAGAIAGLMGYLLMNRWLSRFAYRTEIEISMVLGAIGIALMITMTTISIQAYKAAIVNPVNSLKWE